MDENLAGGSSDTVGIEGRVDGTASAQVDMPLVHSGKVRDLYDAGSGYLLMVATDRISAFDVVMAESIPEKGRVLTAMSAFWFAELGDIAKNHLVAVDPDALPAQARPLAGRAMLVRRAEMLPIECIVRGYLAGSAWKEYEKHGTVHGRPLPSGLGMSARLEEPLFTPSTKALTGHDENIGLDEAASIVGRRVIDEAAEICVAAYERASRMAEANGILIADTKFELGFIDGGLAICDEVLTPDSSRFWPAGTWEVAIAAPSMDKQPLRDWLEASGWDKRPPPPPLPGELVVATSLLYRDIYERLTGCPLSDWYGGK